MTWFYISNIFRIYKQTSLSYWIGFCFGLLYNSGSRLRVNVLMSIREQWPVACRGGMAFILLRKKMGEAILLSCWWVRIHLQSRGAELQNGLPIRLKTVRVGCTSATLTLDHAFPSSAVPGWKVTAFPGPRTMFRYCFCNPPPTHRKTVATALCCQEIICLTAQPWFYP